MAICFRQRFDGQRRSAASRCTLPKSRPRKHQRKAIRDVVQGLLRHERGKLIMACGTGKTLVSMWIHERLRCKCTLLLVPSLSLISQSLAEWARNASQPFDYLLVCSDETVGMDDHAVTSTIELGAPTTTEPAEIARFLRRRRQTPAVIFCTYQSSDRMAESQNRYSAPRLDLILADEAHRCTGPSTGLFATVLHRSKIRAKKRLFMTATPRYYTERVKSSRVSWNTI